jgi:hypothetical protein
VACKHVKIYENKENNKVYVVISLMQIPAVSKEIANIYSTSFNPLRLYITIWDQVAANDGSSSQNNTFQLVILTDGILSFLIYNFGSMTWPNNQFSINAFFWL